MAVSTRIAAGSGPDRRVLKFSQGAYEGDAQYKVLVDGEQVGGILAGAPPALLLAA
jgi:hypothetical protein